MEKLSRSETFEQLQQLPGWSIADSAIAKTFTFNDFREAFAFMAACAIDADRLDHHPDWSNSYNTLHILLTTHDAGGVTMQDIELAKQFERHLQRSETLDDGG